MVITDRAVILDLLAEDEIAEDIGEADADLDRLQESDVHIHVHHHGGPYQGAHPGLAGTPPAGGHHEAPAGSPEWILQQAEFEADGDGDGDALREAREHHFRKAVGHQLFRRVREGAITRQQALRTARQRRTWRKRYGRSWRKRVFGPGWKPGELHRLRARLFTPGGHIFFPQGSKRWRNMDARYKGMVRRRRSAAPSHRRGAAGFRLQRRTPRTRFGGRQALGEAATDIALELIK
jgi:hypothetical protein